MRRTGIAALAIGGLLIAWGAPVQPAAAAKSKFGCEIGSEVWNASEGKCVPGTHKKRVAKKASAKKKTKGE